MTTRQRYPDVLFCRSPALQHSLRWQALRLTAGARMFCLSVWTIFGRNCLVMGKRI